MVERLTSALKGSKNDKDCLKGKDLGTSLKSYIPGR